MNQRTVVSEGREKGERGKDGGGKGTLKWCEERGKGEEEREGEQKEGKDGKVTEMGMLKGQGEEGDRTERKRRKERRK